MTRILILSAFIVLAATHCCAQVQHLEEDKSDAYEEMSSNDITLRFYNAVNGQYIINASVEIANIGSFTTDEEGKVRFPAPMEDGDYAFVFMGEKYVTSELRFTIMAGTIFQRRFSISPMLDIKNLRVVLDWGAAPLDLDAHFVKTNEYHISYRDMKTLADGSAQLDRDATSGYGPETITARSVAGSGNYVYYVHDYTNASTGTSAALAHSNASVKVFGEGRVLKQYNLIDTQKGTVWKVFEIRNGQIVDINKIGPR